MSSVGAAIKVSTDWSQKTMTSLPSSVRLHIIYEGLNAVNRQPSNGLKFNRKTSKMQININHQVPGGGVLPYKRLMGMCRWMGTHVDDWIDYNGVAFFQ